MIGFGIYLLVPNLYTVGSMARESYFFFVVWAVLGFVYFHQLLRTDKTRRFGKSIVVWISLFSLILFVSLVYLFQTIMESMQTGMTNIAQMYTNPEITDAVSNVVLGEMEKVRRVSGNSMTAILFLIALSLAMLIYNFRIISERAQSSEARLGMVQELASRDPLTGVKSRHAYAEKERELDAAITGGTAGSFGIVVCDLNGLKFINDSQGHKTGDERLKQTSKVICNIFSHSPVYRNGGDEFVVYLSGRDYEDRQALMDELHEQSVSHIETGEVVISAGLAEFDADKDTRLRPVFDRADAAMYKEKMLLKKLGAATR